MDVNIYGLRGYACRWDVVDSYGTKFCRGAFARSLAERANMVPLYYGHENIRGPWVMPLGVAHVRETPDGLAYDARLAPSDEAERLLTLVDMGAVTMASFSFLPIKDKEREGIIAYREVDIYEISPTVRGAIPGTTCEVVLLTHAERTDPSALNDLLTYLRGA